MEVSCQCGAVRFNTPTPAPLRVYHCHCTECRKQSASAFGTTALFPNFPIPEDRPLGCYTRQTDSGKTMHCYFCTRCGVRVIHTVDGRSTTSVKGGCIDSLDWSNAAHIWCSRAVVKIPDGVERWEKEPRE